MNGTSGMNNTSGMNGRNNTAGMSGSSQDGMGQKGNVSGYNGKGNNEQAQYQHQFQGGQQKGTYRPQGGKKGKGKGKYRHDRYEELNPQFVQHDVHQYEPPNQTQQTGTELNRGYNKMGIPENAKGQAPAGRTMGDYIGQSLMQAGVTQRAVKDEDVTRSWTERFDLEGTAQSDGERWEPVLKRRAGVGGRGRDRGLMRGPANPHQQSGMHGPHAATPPWWG